MTLRFIFPFIFLFASLAAFGQDGHQIKVKVDNYESTKLILGYQYGGKQYIRDTVEINEDGAFVFDGEEPLNEGLYLVVLQPDNKSIQFMADGDNQHFNMSFDGKEEQLANSVKFKGSKLNDKYYTYLRYLNTKVPEKMALQEKYQTFKDNKAEVAKLQESLKAIDLEVRAYHEELVTKNPLNLLGRLVNARLDPQVPEFTGDDIDVQRYLYYKKHYFDNIDLQDEGLIRAGVLFQKVEYYVKNLTPQMPDSINQTLDYILAKTDGTNNFKFFLINYLNEYAASKIVGMDAVYVHLVENYYAKGKADWASEESLKKMVDNAKTLKPILIGKTAPDIRFKTKENQQISIHELDADYTVLFFWDPDCSHCKKSMPDMISFHDKFQPKGVEVLGICTKVGENDEMKKCWDTVEEKEMGRWINVADQYLQSGYKKTYDITSTPRIFILDKDKKIVMKGIGAEQLGAVMDQIILEEQEKMMDKSGE